MNVIITTEELSKEIEIKDYTIRRALRKGLLNDYWFKLNNRYAWDIRDAEEIKEVIEREYLR